MSNTIGLHSETKQDLDEVGGEFAKARKKKLSYDKIVSELICFFKKHKENDEDFKK